MQYVSLLKYGKLNITALWSIGMLHKIAHNDDTFLYWFHIGSHLPDYPDLSFVDNQKGDQDCLVKGAAN